MWRAAEGYEEAASVEDADLIVLNTCHIRERASEKIYSELGKIRELKDERAQRGARDDAGRGRLRRAGRRRGDPAPATGRRSRRRAAELSSPAATAARAAPRRRGGRHRISARGQVRPSARQHARGDPGARRQRLRHRAGRLRQILLVLRRALHAGAARPRGRSPRCWPRSSVSRGPASAKSP